MSSTVIEEERGSTMEAATRGLGDPAGPSASCWVNAGYLV